ncbi:MAG: TRAP transporter substrate-binding protein [Alphaproteobacteria bacterium]|nr:TRAP transporter substrate-binding protein [Alphaproteobacteria bacterium]
MMKRFAAAAFAGLVALLPGPDAAAQTYQMNIGHVLADTSSYQVGMKYFADEMAKRTNNRVKVNIFPAGGLGGELRLVQGGTTGTVDGFIIGQPSLEATIPEFKILSLPYLFDSEAEAIKVLRGSFGQKFLDLLPKYNMVGLGWAGVFTRGIPATRAVETANDLRGLKVRVMQSPGYISTFNSLGSQPTPIPFGELFMALQTRVVDATDLSPDLVISGQFLKAITHYSQPGIHQLPSIFVMSKAKYDSFPEDIRKIVLEVGRDGAAAATTEQTRVMAAGLEEMRAAGIKISTPNPASFREAAMKAWPSITQGVPNVDAYLDELKKAKAAP